MMIWKRALGAVGAVAAGAGLVLLAPSSAQAADAVQTFRNQATGRCLADYGGLGAVDCGSLLPDDYKWIVHKWADGTVRLQNFTGRLCIRDSNNGFTEAACDSSTNQSWWVKKWADGTIQFRNQATNRCMDDSSAGTRTWTCWAGSDPRSRYQSWY